MRPLGIFLLLLCACLTSARAQVWRTNDTLWTAAADISIPPQVHWHLALAAFQRGDRTTARKELRFARAQLGTLDQHDPLVTLIWLWTDIIGM